MRVIALIALSLLLGCASTQPVVTSTPNTEVSPKAKKACQYLQRDLTVAWQQRSYWCIPTQ